MTKDPQVFIAAVNCKFSEHLSRLITCSEFVLNCLLKTVISAAEVEKEQNSIC